MARPYGEGIVFNILMKVIYIAYLAMYMAYAVLNYIAETGNDLVNFIVILFISISIVIFVIANILDWVYKNADARSKIKVRLHTLRNMFKIIKVGVTILVLAQTISDDSWNALTITMLVISLPTSLLWLLGEYIYVAVTGIFRRGNKKSSEDTDEEYEDSGRVTPVHDTIERVKQFAESELIVLRPHEVDYDSDEEEDVEDRYLGYEEDDDYSYPPAPRAMVQTAQEAQPRYPEYKGEFSVEELPMPSAFSIEEYDMSSVLAEEKKAKDDWQIEEIVGEVSDEPASPAEEQTSEESTQLPEEEQAEQSAEETSESEQSAEEVTKAEQEPILQKTSQAEQTPVEEEQASAKNTQTPLENEDAEVEQTAQAEQLPEEQTVQTEQTPAEEEGADQGEQSPAAEEEAVQESAEDIEEKPLLIEKKEDIKRLNAPPKEGAEE